MKDEEQDITEAQDTDRDAPDLDADEIDQEEAAPDAKPSRGDRRFQKLANENRELRERIARMEGRLEAAGQKTPEEPQFDSDQEEFNYKLMQHAKSLEAKLKRLEEKEAAAEAEKKHARLISRAMSGLGFGKQAQFAQEHLALYVRLHPHLDADDLRDYARKLAVKMGFDQKGKDYVDEKKADQNATKRPSQTVQQSAPKGSGERPKSAQERLQATREAALAKLRAASEK